MLLLAFPFCQSSRVPALSPLVSSSFNCQCNLLDTNVLAWILRRGPRRHHTGPILVLRLLVEHNFKVLVRGIERPQTHRSADSVVSSQEYPSDRNFVLVPDG